MPDFFNYIQPLIEWLRVNPQWSFFITFFISMLESVAIIGSIVPGSVTMTAIGILAGSGVMRIDMTLIAATLGAMLGDNLSYGLGYYYRDNLKQMWPFSRYPGWLNYGSDFFKKHGGKSVFIGRFVGPLRSLIPVIAGMMQMKQGRFFIANFLSAILWAIGHVMPGVLIGSASSQLSKEAATRLFILVLLTLVIIWLVSLAIKWFIVRLRYFFRGRLSQSWLLLKDHPILSYCYKSFTPPKEVDHYPTVIFFLLTLFSLIISITLVLLVHFGLWVKAVDVPIQWLMESTKTSMLGTFFIACTQLISTATLVVLFGTLVIAQLVKKDYKTLAALVSLLFFSILIPWGLSLMIAHPRPTGLLVTMPGSAFPNIHLTVATALYAAIMLSVTHGYAFITNTWRAFILIVLGLSGLGLLYLGDNWFSDLIASYFIGLSICLVHWIVFRKSTPLTHQKSLAVFGVITALLLSVSALSTVWNIKRLAHNHTLSYNVYFLEEKQWWNQQSPLLPFYKYNRLGHIIGLFNIQYLGNLSVLQGELEKQGWTVPTDTFFQLLLKRMDTQKESINLPLLPQLYLNKKPELTMIHKDKASGKELVLRLWESNYLLNEETSIWIGSVEVNKSNKEKQGGNNVKPVNLLGALKPALASSFLIRSFDIPQERIKTTPRPIEPVIYFIKMKEPES